MERVLSLQEISLLALTKEFDTLEKVISFCESSELLHNVSSVADEFWKETLRRHEQGEFIETRGDLDPIVLGRGVWYLFVKNLVAGINHEYILTHCNMDGTKMGPINVHPFCPRLPILPNQGIRAYYCFNIRYPNKGFHRYDVFYYTDAKQSMKVVMRTIAQSFLIDIGRRREDGYIIQVSCQQMSYRIPAENFSKDSLCPLANAQFDTNMTIALTMVGNIYMVDNILPHHGISARTYQIFHAVVG